MTPSSKIKFRPLPHIYLPYNSGDVEKIKVEINIAEGEVARFLTLPDFFSGYLSVHLNTSDEEDLEGLPGNFFIVKTIGRSEASCGGYIGEHRGPKTLQIWFANRSMTPVTLSGAISIEPIETVEQENERAQRAVAWEERKEKLFETFLQHLPVVMNIITQRHARRSRRLLVERLRSLLTTIEPPQMLIIMNGKSVV